MIALYLSPIVPAVESVYLLRWAYLWMGSMPSAILRTLGFRTYIRSNLCIALHKSAYQDFLLKIQNLFIEC